jgi:hypothetical protein
MCPRTAICVSSSHYICVLILENVCSHTAIRVLLSFVRSGVCVCVCVCDSSTLFAYAFMSAVMCGSNVCRFFSFFPPSSPGKSGGDGSAL